MVPSSNNQERLRASRVFQYKLAADPRYELVDGEYKLRVEEVVDICKINVEFFLYKFASGNFSRENELIITSYKQLINAITNKIIKDHC